jgi:hypothetical protein
MEKERVPGDETGVKREVRLYKYIGETNRSPYERGLEHLSDS